MAAKKKNKYIENMAMLLLDEGTDEEIVVNHLVRAGYTEKSARAIVKREKTS
jgi:hypothetical protein